MTLIEENGISRQFYLVRFQVTLITPKNCDFDNLLLLIQTWSVIILNINVSVQFFFLSIFRSLNRHWYDFFIVLKIVSKISTYIL